MSFPNGATVVVRQLFRGRVWSANAAIVVEDSRELVALWLPTGSDSRSGRGSDLFGEWTLQPVRLKGPMLRLTRPGEAHSFLRFQHDDGTFRGWYVNLERPLRRTGIGFDFDDLLLDLWLEDGEPWRVLDEHELDEAIARGALSPADAALARSEADRVMARGRVPTEWADWEPPSTWGVPSLPTKWDVP